MQNTNKTAQTEMNAAKHKLALLEIPENAKFQTIYRYKLKTSIDLLMKHSWESSHSRKDSTAGILTK
jgi:hypothetical protein